MLPKSVLITGATGLVGTALLKKFSKEGITTGIVTTRAPQSLTNLNEVITWEQIKLNPGVIRKYEAIIHLAGANVAGKRWTETYKKEIFDSRVETTGILVSAITQNPNKPKVFVSASAVGIYGDTGENKITESVTEFPDTFLSKVCREWEKSSEPLVQLGIRRVVGRIGVVISPEGGALKEMLLPFKLGLGGPLGNGKQWFAWVHIDDVVNIFYEMVVNTSMSGVYNVTAPNPVRMKEFASALGKVLHRPSLFPVPEFVMALMKGKDIASVVMASQHHTSERLTRQGYRYGYPEIYGALQSFFK